MCVYFNMFLHFVFLILSYTEYVFNISNVTQSEASKVQHSQQNVQ